MGDEERTIPSPPKFNAPSTHTDDVSNMDINNDIVGISTTDSEKQRTAAPPPPKFSAPLPPSYHRPATDPAKAAVLAAAKAAQHATPAQRERMVMEAAAQALAQRTEAEAAAKNNSSDHKNTTPAAAAQGPYEPPSWTSTPPTIPFSIEIMKQGTIISTLNLQQLCIDTDKGYLTLGRAPTNDILLDHPSSSRVHAVFEFRVESPQNEDTIDSKDASAMYLFDPGSTHGCYVNKARISAGQHFPLHVGDMLRFGESTRVMILCGPAELMVEEGPSREQIKQAAALETLKRMKEKDAAAAKLAMAKAIAAGGGGVSWGFGEDAREDSDEENDGRGSKDEIDWREHAANKGLTDKQQKIADKIRKREARILNLQKESEKIQLKYKSMEEMSAGQANTIARNEEEVEKAMVEIEELEDQLVASIEDSISGKNKKGVAVGKNRAKGAGGKKRRRDGGSDSEEDGGDSDEDSFYDRTGKAARRTKTGGSVGGGGGKGGKSGGEEAFEDAASLYGSLETLKEEKTRVEALLLAETATLNANNKQQQQTADASAAAAGTITDNTTTGIDSLDDFMAGVESTIESDRSATLRKELAQIEAKITTTARLLSIADPDEFYKPGSKAAELAVQRARKAVQIEQKRKEAEEKQKRVALAAKMAKETAFIEEKEEEEEEDGGKEEEKTSAAGQEGKQVKGSMHHLEAAQEQGSAPFGLQLQTKKDSTTSTPPPTTTATTTRGAVGGNEPSAYEKRRAGIAASLQALKSSSGPQNQRLAEPDAATANVLADLAVLQKAKRGAAVVAAEAEVVEGRVKGQQGLAGSDTKEVDVVWLPPEDQKGDGRTSLNDKFGY
jgi:pSer/pThr/pTyr-binding forkhead associated (FHA) protein